MIALAPHHSPPFLSYVVVFVIFFLLLSKKSNLIGDCSFLLMNFKFGVSADRVFGFKVSSNHSVTEANVTASEPTSREKKIVGTAHRESPH